MPKTDDQVIFFVKSSLYTSHYNNWSIFGHLKTLSMRFEKLAPSGLKPDPDLTLPHTYMESPPCASEDLEGQRQGG